MDAANWGDFRILTGPTGSGKTQLALRLARNLNAEIIALDSMTLYRGMDVGTAKPSPEQRRQVPHHLIDVLDPSESASVAWWLEQARVCCREIAARGKRILFVGGTPLYLKALLYGLFDGPPADEVVRLRLQQEAERDGLPALHARLAAVDPASATRLHANDVRRVIRALEVWELTARPISAWQQQWRGTTSGLAENHCLYLDVPRDVLYQRLNARVDAMLAEGLVEEVRGLMERHPPLSREARQAVGYKEILAHLAGACDLATAIDEVKKRSRHLAKHQLTWFRQIPECRPAGEHLTFALWGLTIE
jgi:tRNA dimethylallyltransferase